MTTQPHSPSIPPSMYPAGSYKRSLRNYIVDARFQFKYTSYLVLVAVLIGGFLGAFLWRTSREVIVQGQQVVAESRKVSDVVRMSMQNDPFYGKEAGLMADFNREAATSEQGIQAQLVELERRQSNMLRALVGSFVLVVFLSFVFGIYITHKVAGPIYKMKLLLRQVGEGKLVFRGKLRKGDELQDFFDAFADMVDKLHARQRTEVEQLERALEMARSTGADAESLSRIARVRDQMKSALEHDPAMPSITALPRSTRG